MVTVGDHGFGVRRGRNGDYGGNGMSSKKRQIEDFFASHPEVAGPRIGSEWLGGRLGEILLRLEHVRERGPVTEIIFDQGKLTLEGDWLLETRFEGMNLLVVRGFSRAKYGWRDGPRGERSITIDAGEVAFRYHWGR